jgi:hypothetical protein
MNGRVGTVLLVALLGVGCFAGKQRRAALDAASANLSCPRREINLAHVRRLGPVYTARGCGRKSRLVGFCDAEDCRFFDLETTHQAVAADGCPRSQHHGYTNVGGRTMIQGCGKMWKFELSSQGWTLVWSGPSR